MESVKFVLPFLLSPALLFRVSAPQQAVQSAVCDVTYGQQYVYLSLTFSGEQSNQIYLAAPMESRVIMMSKII